MRHVVVPYDRSNSSIRARALQWIERVTTSGTIEPRSVVVHGPGWPDRRVDPGTPTLLLRNAKRVTRGRRERSLMTTAAPGIYDLDDGLPWDDGNLAGLGQWWKRPFPRSLVAQRAASAADRVIAGNETIADWASEWCDDVVVVPTCVDPAEYSVRTSWDIAGDGAVIGWIGSPATEHYLFDIADALVEIHARLGARLEIVSGEGTIPAPIARFTSRRRWNEDATSWIAGWDLGIMPLRDGVYERAKCGYKLLQYAASGVPAVGSPVGVNRTLLSDMDGFGATTTGDWVESVCEMLSEPAGRREQRADRGFEVARRHSYSEWESTWLDAVGWSCASST